MLARQAGMHGQIFVLDLRPAMVGMPLNVVFRAPAAGTVGVTRLRDPLA